MMKGIGLLLLCCMIFISHVSESYPCVDEVVETSHSSEDHDGCHEHHCHHGHFFSVPFFVTKVSFEEKLLFQFFPLEITFFSEEFLRPPAHS